ncbi:MAG: hypothetical protein RBR81_11380 [Bacteroidales bacterium]|nr:hypothetical protein [Bacteroidales bacterium]
MTKIKLFRRFCRSGFMVSLSLLVPAMRFILVSIIDPSVSSANNSSYTGT